MEKVNTLFKRDETKLKSAPAWIIYLNAVSLAVMFFVIIMFFATKTMLVKYFCAILFLFLFCFGKFSDIYFNFYEDLNYEFFRNKFECKYKLNQSVIPSAQNIVTITCRNLKKVKLKRSSIIVYGDITTKRPLKKEIKNNHVELKLDHFGQDKEKIISNIEKLIKGV